MAVSLEAVLSYLMHVDGMSDLADGSVKYTGYGVVKEWVSLLEGCEILCREGIIHLDYLGSRIGLGYLPSRTTDRWDFMPFFIGGVDFDTFGSHDEEYFG